MLFCKFYDFSYFRVYRPSNIWKFKNVVVKMKIMLGKNQRHFWKVLNLLLLSLYYGHNDKPIISGCKMTLKVAKIAILAVFRGLYLKNRISKVVQIFFDGRLMSCEGFKRKKLLTMDISVGIWAFGSPTTVNFQYFKSMMLISRNLWICIFIKLLRNQIWDSLYT